MEVLKVIEWRNSSHNVPANQVYAFKKNANTIIQFRHELMAEVIILLNNGQYEIPYHITHQLYRNSGFKNLHFHPVTSKLQSKNKSFFIH
jgi:hypothetical protein